MIKPDPKVAIELVNRGITLTAYKVREDGRKIPWAKDWANIEELPLKTEHDVLSCIESGCHGFQMRAIDAGLCVIDLDIRGNKDGLVALEQATKLHGVKSASKFMNSGYVVKTPNDGYHVYLKADEAISTISRDGILHGVDLICSRKKLIAIEGSIAPHKVTGEFMPYVGSGHIDNAIVIPQDLSKMFITIIDNEERLKEEARQKKLQEAMERRKNLVQYEGASIFDEASKRVNPQLIEDLFNAPGAFWQNGKNGMEYFTLNPTRPDNHVGSFSIRQDGIYSDFSNDHQDAGDLITLLEKAYNLKPYEAACMIIKETGGNPEEFKSKQVAPAVRIGKVGPIESSPPKIEPSESFEDDIPGEQEPPKPDHKPIYFPLKRLGEMSLEEEEWLIDRLFQADSLALTYGKPGAGKSFWALDASLCIATGKSFHGNEVKQGPVVYMAGEGHKGIYKRALAWQKHYGIDAQNAPWWLAGKPFDLIDTMSVEAVLTAIDHHTQGVKPALVVIDTLARNFGAGDENKTSDMGMVIRNADAIRVKYGCLVNIVHHSGHDSDRARGSSALKAAMDFEYCVSQPEENILMVANTRMKDGEKPDDMSYRLTDVELGKQHKWGAEIKSAVLVEEVIEKSAKKKEVLGDKQQLALDVLEILLEEKKDNLRGALKDVDGARVSKHELSMRLLEEGMLKQNTYRTIKGLVEKKIFKAEGEDLYL